MTLPDIQNERDERGVNIDWIGIEGYRVPFNVKTKNGTGKQTTVGEIDIFTNLSEKFKGANMSRYTEVIEDAVSKNLMSSDFIKEMLIACKNKLEAENSYIVVKFPYYLKRKAPVSEKVSHSVYDCNICGVLEDGEIRTYLEVNVPYTSLCPCSREISKAGAHNQRSNANIRVKFKNSNDYIFIEDIIIMVEEIASCPIWNSLKRPDEKYVTERAFENPMFVEDMIRDISLVLDKNDKVAGYKVKVRHFESIHQHNAVARIIKDIK